MSRHWLFRLLWMVAVVPLFLAAALPAHTSTLVCRFTGVIMPEQSCCPDGGGVLSATQARLRDPECCAIRNVDRAPLVSEQAPGAGFERVRMAVLAFNPPAAKAPLPTWRSVSIRLLATSAFRPPPLALKHSLLI